MQFRRLFRFLLTSALFVIFALRFSASDSFAYTGGYLFPYSAKWGETINFYLSTTGSKAKVEIFRQGVVQEKVAEINNVPGTYLPCEHHSEIGCFFPKVYSLTLNSSYKPGLYLAKFINLNTPEEEDLAFFVVKPDLPGTWSKIAVVLPFNTWEVHNFREGKKVYPSPYSPGYEERARTASFLRPWINPCTNLEICYPIGGVGYIWWLESQGYFPEYLTDADLDQNPNILSHYKLGISIAHHEYWSWNMRDSVENYVNNGGNFLFLSGNVSWWQIRYENNHSFIRVYKLKEEDPLFLDNNPSNDHLVTVNWYDNPILRPETQMTGTSFFYGGFWEPGPQSYDQNHFPGFTVYRTNDQKWGWVFNNTGLKDGDVIGVGMFQQNVENDGTHFRFDNGLPVVTDTSLTKTPENFTILGLSDITRHGGGLGQAVMGIRETAKGGIVFSAGQEYFSGSLVSQDKAVERIVLNLIERLAPNEQKPKPILPYSTGGLKIVEFNPPKETAEFDFTIESDLCSLNAGLGTYWIWVLTDQPGTDGSFYYSFGGDINSWFPLSRLSGNYWTEITEPTTGFPKSFTLKENLSYRFKFSPRSPSAKIKKIIFTNTSYFPPAKFQFEDRPSTVIDLPFQEINEPQPKFTATFPSQDSYIAGWFAETNYGNSNNLKIKNDRFFKSLINFDLSSLPLSVKINRAFVKLFLMDNSNNYPVSVGVYSLKKPWVETEVTWQQAKNNSPWQIPGASGEEDYSSGNIVKQTIKEENQWYYFDVTSILENYADEPSRFNGFLFSPIGENSGTTFLTFWSDEFSAANYRPMLEINYTPPNQSTTLTPTPTPFSLPTNTPSPTPTPTPIPIPTPSPTLIPSICQPNTPKVNLYSQEGWNWKGPPLVWDPNFGQKFTLNESIIIDEIEIKVKNWGGGQKPIGVALTKDEGKKLENNLPSPLIKETTGIVPGNYYQGWVTIDFSQTEIILDKEIPYFIWLKDPYNGFGWAMGSLKIWGRKCQGEAMSPTPIPTATATLTPKPTNTPAPTSIPPGPTISAAGCKAKNGVCCKADYGCCVPPRLIDPNRDPTSGGCSSTGYLGGWCCSSCRCQ